MAASSTRVFTPADQLDKYDPAAPPRSIEDLGSIVVFFDHRHIKPAEDGMPALTSYYLQGLSKMGWASYWNKPDVEPGCLRLVWYTHAGAEGHRDYPCHKAYTVKEMFDDLSSGGFRPMIIGWSGENPFPMIGGSEPPEAPKPPKMKTASTASGTVSGHAGAKAGTTPHDRVMAIIDKEDALEEKQRTETAERKKKAEALGYAELTAAQRKAEEAGFGA